MAISYYDEAVTQKIKGWLADSTKLRVLSPEESNRLIQLNAEDSEGIGNCGNGDFQFVPMPGTRIRDVVPVKLPCYALPSASMKYLRQFRFCISFKFNHSIVLTDLSQTFHRIIKGR